MRVAEFPARTLARCLGCAHHTRRGLALTPLGAPRTSPAGGVGGKKKNDADEEDDDSVEAELAQSPPDKGRLALAMGAPPAAPPALTAAQAREAAQRERERLNLALGRVRLGRAGTSRPRHARVSVALAPGTDTLPCLQVASGGVADVKPGAAVASKPVVVAPAAVARPAAAPVPQPPPLAGTAAAALRGAGAAVPAPLASAVTQMPRTLSQQPGGVGGGAPPGAAVAAKQTGAPVPVAGPPRPNSGVAAGQSQPGGAALARLGPPALSGIAGGARPGSDEGAAADAVALPKGPAACKFCIFCRDRGHEPPFHWCSDDRAVMPPLRGPSPYGAVRQAISV